MILNNKPHILNLNLEELEQIVLSFGEKKYRAGQVLECLYNGKKIAQANIPESLKTKLEESFAMPQIEILQTFKSENSDTIKHLFKLKDGALVEGVVMSYIYGKSFCISCQVGCKMGCVFCTSGENGFGRNLETGEMLEMAILAGAKPANKQLSNMVLMGSGEPLDNIDNVLKFLKIATHHKGLNFSQRGVSLSTCGIVPKIKALADSGLKITLSVSLHASNNIARKKIMKIAEAYKIEEVVAAAKYYFEKTGRRVLFEYVLIDGINDSFENAKELSTLLKGFPAHINLISLNEKKGSQLKAVSQHKAYAFCEKLKEYGTFATIRRVLGNDIEGACGQLRAKFVGDITPVSSGKKED